MEGTIPRTIIIACGSFSPPTPMHLRMFEIAKDYFEMNCLYKVIGGIISPTHDSYGKQGLVPAIHRCAMIKLATRSSDWIRLSDWEVKQSEWSRTKLVVQYHKNYINNYLNSSNYNDENVPDWQPANLRSSRDEIHLKLICGADLLESFSVPGLWLDDDIEEIVGNHGIIVISRSGSNPEKFIFESDTLTKYRKNITLITNWVPNEISSSMIRRLVSRGESVKYLIDDMIIEYMKRHGLYKSKTSTLDMSKNKLSNITSPKRNGKRRRQSREMS